MMPHRLAFCALGPYPGDVEIDFDELATVPCPVCGSTDHPNPAKPARDAVRIEEVESAEAVVEAATEAEERAQTAHQQIASQVAELRGRAGDAATDPDAAAEMAEGMTAELQAARDLAGQVDDLQRTVATHQDAASAATEAAQRAALAASGAAGRAGALFVDEGFGTLDSEALHLAMDEVDRLREGGRTVGLISHVSELRERIRTGIEVRPTDSGSAISVGAVAQM